MEAYSPMSMVFPEEAEPAPPEPSFLQPAAAMIPVAAINVHAIRRFIDVSPVSPEAGERLPGRSECSSHGYGPQGEHRQRGGLGRRGFRVAKATLPGGALVGRVGAGFGHNFDRARDFGL